MTRYAYCPPPTCLQETGISRIWNQISPLGWPRVGDLARAEGIGPVPPRARCRLLGGASGDRSRRRISLSLCAGDEKVRLPTRLSERTLNCVEGVPQAEMPVWQWRQDRPIKPTVSDDGVPCMTRYTSRSITIRGVSSRSSWIFFTRIGALTWTTAGAASMAARDRLPSHACEASTWA